MAYSGRIQEPLHLPGRVSKPAQAGASRRRRQRPGADAAAPPARPALGVAEEALTPELRQAVARIATERDRLHEELTKARAKIAALERLADEDALTPVANRRAFVRELSRMIAFSHRYGVPASLVYFDVNNMKQINDEHGHAAGDAALRQVAAVLRDNIRSSDVVGRLGGDEFGVVLAQTDAEQAHNKAAALAAAIAERPLRWGKYSMPVSAAFGVYAFSGTEKPQHAIEAADRAMYARKRAAARAGS